MSRCAGRGRATLFFVEMWERSTYYGMRALLVLFLVNAITNGGFGLDDKSATAIYGLYSAAVYLVALGNLVAGAFAGEFDSGNLADMPGQYMHIVWLGAISAVALLLVSPVVEKWMGGVE